MGLRPLVSRLTTPSGTSSSLASPLQLAPSSWQPQPCSTYQPLWPRSEQPLETPHLARSISRWSIFIGNSTFPFPDPLQSVLTCGMHFLLVQCHQCSSRVSFFRVFTA